MTHCSFIWFCGVCNIKFVICIHSSIKIFCCRHSLQLERMQEYENMACVILRCFVSVDLTCTLFDLSCNSLVSMYNCDWKRKYLSHNAPNFRKKLLCIFSFYTDVIIPCHNTIVVSTDRPNTRDDHNALTLLCSQILTF